MTLKGSLQSSKIQNSHKYSTLVEINYLLLEIIKVPKSDFQSEISMLRIIGIFLISFYSIRNNSLGARFLITSIFEQLYFLKACSISDEPSPEFRDATANFCQARPPQWRAAAAAAAAFYSAKSRQGLGLGGLASRGGPEMH